MCVVVRLCVFVGERGRVQEIGPYCDPDKPGPDLTVQVVDIKQEKHAAA